MLTWTFILLDICIATCYAAQTNACILWELFINGNKTFEAISIKNQGLSIALAFYHYMPSAVKGLTCAVVCQTDYASSSEDHSSTTPLHVLTCAVVCQIDYASSSEGHSSTTPLHVPPRVKTTPQPHLSMCLLEWRPLLNHTSTCASSSEDHSSTTPLHVPPRVKITPQPHLYMCLLEWGLLLNHTSTCTRRTYPTQRLYMYCTA